jgi:phosphate/sulfate permease
MRRNQVLSSLFAAGAAFLLARGCGLPVWDSWPVDWSYRDAADVAVFTGLAMWFAMGGNDASN